MKPEAEKTVEETPQETPIKKTSKLPIIAIILGVLILFVLLFIAGYVVLSSKKPSDNAILTPTPTPEVLSQKPTPTSKLPSEIIETGAKGQKKYINYTYGFSFEFPTVSQGTEPISIKEVGNKIYVYNTKYPYTQGQYVEIFQKSASDTLEQALQKQFLTNIPQSDCFVKDAKPDTSAQFPSTYVLKTLGYPVDENSDVPAFAQTNKCPEPYAATNGLSYFLGDSKHPSVYLFFSIGQYGIDVESPQKMGWQDTIKFTD